MPESRFYGALAEFKSPDALMAAAKEARAAGYRSLDAFTPFPVEGLAELLGFRDRRILTIGLMGAIFGFAAAVAMQVLANYDYPLDIGGRPLYALSAFAVIAFELTILFSAGFTAFGMLWLNRLPRLHYPVFSASRFHLASRDRFFLCVKADDPRFLERDTVDFLRRLDAHSVELVKT
jgi:hypothetical protein